MRSADIEIERYLSVLPLFCDLSLDELRRLAQGCALRRLSRGQMVFRAGEPCEAFYVVILGQVKLSVLSPAGQEKVIELIGAGQSFAEAMVFLDKPYVVDVQALTDTLLLRVGKSAVFDEIERDSGFAKRMLAGISRRLHGLVHDVRAYALESGMQRLIGYLLRDLGEADSAAASLRVSLPVSKATVASRLSLTPEYFSRVLHDLEAAGLICIEKRDIHIPDVQRLIDFSARRSEGRAGN